MTGEPNPATPTPEPHTAPAPDTAPDTAPHTEPDTAANTAAPDTAAPLDGLTDARAGEVVSDEEPIDFAAEPWDLPWKAEFLKALTGMANVTQAARSVGLTRQATYLARKKDARFAAAWRQAVEEGVDTLEGFATRMGSAGLETVETRTTTKRTRNAEGQLVVVDETTVEIRSRTVSPQMAMFLLSAHRPSKYRRAQRFEHTGADGGPIESVTKEQNDAAVGAFRAEVVRLADARSAREGAGGGGAG